LFGWEYDRETKRRERFPIARPQDLDQNCLQGKERRLTEIVKHELKAGRRCHIYAVYTQRRDVTRGRIYFSQRAGMRARSVAREGTSERVMKDFRLFRIRGACSDAESPQA
jgi:hypothetical protein